MGTECFDAAIVGGGFAGMTAAMYVRRGGRKPVIFEAEMFGGQIVSSAEVENYPGVATVGGAELAQAAEDQLDRLEVEKRLARVVGLRREGEYFCVVTDGGETVLARTVILAPGVRHRKLEIPGEERFTGRGISWCATCDGNFFRGKEVAVAGGGNTAVQEALHLSELCAKVYLIHRRAELRAEEWLAGRMRERENIVFLPDTVIREVKGTERLESLLLENLKTGERHELSVSGLFEAVGMIPQNEVFSSLVKSDPNGYIEAGEDCKTNVPGIFAAGDCRAKSLRQLISAASDGAVAAMNVLELLR